MYAQRLPVNNSLPLTSTLPRYYYGTSAFLQMFSSNRDPSHRRQAREKQLFVAKYVCPSMMSSSKSRSFILPVPQAQPIERRSSVPVVSSVRTHTADEADYWYTLKF